MASNYIAEFDFFFEKFLFSFCAVVAFFISSGSTDPHPVVLRAVPAECGDGPRSTPPNPLFFLRRNDRRLFIVVSQSSIRCGFHAPAPLRRSFKTVPIVARVTIAAGIDQHLSTNGFIFRLPAAGPRIPDPADFRPAPARRRGAASWRSARSKFSPCHIGRSRVDIDVVDCLPDARTNRATRRPLALTAFATRPFFFPPRPGTNSRPTPPVKAASSSQASSEPRARSPPSRLNQRDRAGLRSDQLRAKTLHQAIMDRAPPPPPPAGI